MATVLELALAQKLHKLDPQLEYGEREWRWIYGFPRFFARLEGDLPSWTSQWDTSVTPVQQLDAFVEVYASGDELAFWKQFHPVQPIGDGVWELKTEDVRVFGWFWKKDCFVATNVESAFYVKTHDLYRGFVGEAVRLRDALDLNEPKFVPGEDPNDVISNYSYTY